MDLRHGLQLGLAGGVFEWFQRLDNFEDGVFSIADDEKVDEGGQGFRIVCARASGEDQGVVFTAICASKG